MTASDIIDRMGGTSKVAQFFGICPASVSEWRQKGIPKARLLTLKYAKPELFDKPRKRRNGL